MAVTSHAGGGGVAMCAPKAFKTVGAHALGQIVSRYAETLQAALAGVRARIAMLSAEKTRRVHTSVAAITAISDAMMLTATSIARAARGVLLIVVKPRAVMCVVVHETADCFVATWSRPPARLIVEAAVSRRLTKTKPMGRTKGLLQ